MKLSKISSILKKAKKKYKKEPHVYNSVLTNRVLQAKNNHHNHNFSFSSENDINNNGDYEENYESSSQEESSYGGGEDYKNIKSDARIGDRNYINITGSVPNIPTGSNQVTPPESPIEFTNPQPTNQAQPQPVVQAPPNPPVQPTAPIQSPTQSQQPNINVQQPTNPLPNIPPELLAQNPGNINIISKNYIGSGDDLEEYDGEPREPKKEKKHITLAKVPDNILKSSSTDWEPINFRGVDDEYPLDGPSRVEIKFNEEHQKLVYSIIEPTLSEEETEKLEELKKAFIFVFEKFTLESLTTKGRDIIIEGTKKLASRYKIKLNDEETEKITYFLIRDFLGLESIEPIMHDHYIEDISCDGLNVPIFVNHLKYGALEVNRSYDNPIKLNSFIVKLAQKSNQEVSLSKPILQGALPDGSRVEAIYGKEISEKGSSFTIRKFRAEPFTPIHLIEFGTMPPFLLAYLWLAVENKQSILVSGGTATGKTTILNALSLFAPPTSKIVSIEDTPEINLPHEHWLPMVARESEGKGEVSMFDLLKASLRERPDYIIVGEIRGAEAAILFQGMATGHAGLGTVHAEKFSDLVNRMIIEPISLPPQLLTELKIVIFMKQVKVKDNVVRRVNSVVEIIDYDSKRDKFETNEFVKFLVQGDTFEFEEKSAIISHLLEIRGGEEESLWNEIEKRRRILDEMYKNKLTEFAEVSSIIKAYYKDPKNISSYLDEFVKKKGEKKDDEQ